MSRAHQTSLRTHGVIPTATVADVARTLTWTICAIRKRDRMSEVNDGGPVLPLSGVVCTTTCS